MINKFLYKAKKNPYLFFVVNLLLFFAVVFILDFTAGSLLKKFYFKQISGQQYRTTYSMEKTTADILIFGSSRANHHYIPAVFEKEFGKECYNAGRDGSHIFYHYAVLQSVLKRYTPKIALLDFTIMDIQQEADSYDRLASLLPYYASHPEIRETVELKSSMEKIKLLSKAYPYNSAALNILKGNTKKETSQEKNDKGYLPLFKTWQKPLGMEPNTGNEPADSIKIKYMEKFITDCKNAGTKLYLVHSPFYFKYTNRPAAFETVAALAARYNVKVFDLSSDPFFAENTALFSDPSHLNDKGAHVFSEKLISLIKEDMAGISKPQF